MKWLSWLIRRTETQIALGLVFCASALRGSPILSSTTLGGVCLGLFLVFIGCYELTLPRSRRIAHAFYALSIAAFLGWFLEFILTWF